MNDTPQLKSHVEQLEALIEQKAEACDALKLGFALAQGEGFDVKVLRDVIKRRAIERALVEEHDALIVTYEEALA